jgi:hypothetical protein
MCVAGLWLGAAGCSDTANRNVVGGPGIGVGAVDSEDAGALEAGLERGEDAGAPGPSSGRESPP